MDFDAITEQQLRDIGSLKWTMYPDAIGAFVAEMDFGLAPPITQAVTEAIGRGFTGYLPARLIHELSAATASWYERRYGWSVPAENVHHVPDVLAAFEAVINAYTPPGSAVIVPTPAYMPFLRVPVTQGRSVIEVPSIEVDGRLRIDLEGVARAFDDGGGLLVLCNPHNPLGTVYTREELLAVSEVVERKGGRVFVDEIHAPLVYEPAAHIPYASLSEATARHSITAASASKAWNLAGLKCAQLIFSHPADIERWKTAGERVRERTSTIGAVASVAAYTEGEPWLREVTGYLDGNRRRLAELVSERMPRARLFTPEATYIALIDFRDYGIEGDLGAWFREHAGVAMTDGASCGEVAKGHTRFIFALPRPIMERAVIRIAEALPV